MSNEQSGTEAFAELAMPLFDSLYNFGRWLTQNDADAEDLVQETYAKALKGFGSFQPGTNFRAWIFRILRNTFLTSRAGLKASATVSFDDSPEEPPGAVTHETPETILLARALEERLAREIDALPVMFREVVLLADVEEMSYQEISETLGIPLGTVMSRLSRARGALRDALEKESPGA